MVTWDHTKRVPVIVKTMKSSCDIFIPDLDMTVHGRDFISAAANAVLKCTAIYYYSLQHNLPCELNSPYNEVERLALKEGKGCFATLLSLSE